MGDYDVIIVGTGAGGGTLARHLAPAGKRILLLERGDWLTREPQHWADQDVFVDHPYAPPGAGGGGGAPGRAADLVGPGRIRGHPLRLAGDVVRRERQALPARCPLLRRWSDEALRRCA